MSFDGQTGRTCKFSKYVARVTGRDSKSPEADAIEESKQTADAGLAAFEKENRAATVSELRITGAANEFIYLQGGLVLKRL